MNILHCDLDAFFASVEQRDNPSLLGIPVIIGGSPFSRGVVSTCSYEARAYGVRSAMPLSHAYRLCPQGIFLPPQMNKYLEASARVFDILSSYTPIIEILSIDEAFLDVRGCHDLFGNSLNIGRSIRSRVRAETGLSISIGIADNKFLAKLATNFSKPDGLMELDAKRTKELLPELPVEALWGIGQKTSHRLKERGIYKVSDLSEMPYSMLKKLLGSNADFILGLAQGIDPRPVTPQERIKSIGNETTFSEDIAEIAAVEQILLELSCQAGFRLRRAGLKAHTINLKLRNPAFKTITRSYTCKQAIDSDLALYNTALKLYNKSGWTGKHLRLCGINCSNLVDKQIEQLSLFTEKSEKVDCLIDELRAKFPQTVVKRAALLKKHEDS